MEAMTLDLERRQAFCALIDEHRRIVLKVANTYCRLRADREDLAQEIVSQLWCAFPSYDPARSFSTWMYRIALNVAISHVRHHVRRPTVPLDDSHHEIADDAGDDIEQEERAQALYRFIDGLDDMNRALLLYLDDKSYREIAEIIGISETDVSTKINRLKNRMKTEFARNAD